MLLRRQGGSWEGQFGSIQSGDGFSLAECGNFSLAGLLLGKEKFFLSPLGFLK